MRRLCALFLAACGPAVEPLALEDGCQPLLADCFLPYPSSFFLAPDPSLPSGARMRLSGRSRLVSAEGKSAVLHEHRASDGASRLPSIGFAFDARIDPRQTVRIADDPARSVDLASPTLIIDAETGALVPHWVDVDPEATARQMVVLHPLVRLAPERRYVVVVKDLDGIAVPEGFRRLRDRVEDAGLAALAERFEREVFPVVAAAGVERSRLLLAFDFATQSEVHPKRDLLRVRALTRAWLASNTPEVEVTKVSELPGDRNWRTVEGRVVGPMFLENADPGAALLRDERGEVALRGTVEFRFLAKIPGSVRSATVAAPVVGFGHGIFGDRRELNTDLMQGLIDDTGVVMLAIDWWGMSMADVFLVVDGLVSRPSEVLELTDRLHQAMANWIVMGAALRGPLREAAAFRKADGRPLYDPASMSFLGMSIGHILAGTLAALSPDFERFALHVGGAGFGHMLTRARPFGPFLRLMENSLPDALDRQKFLLTMQEHFDPIDGGSYAEHVLAAPLEGAPPERRVLLQIGLGDVQVPNLASFLHARLLGVPLLAPAPAAVFGLAERNAPVDGSALALYDLGVDLSVYDEATTRVAPNEVHDGLRRVPAARRQLRTFFGSGRIEQYCEGPCDPE